LEVRCGWAGVVFGLQTVACQLPHILARRLVTTGLTTTLQTLDQTGWLLVPARCLEDNDMTFDS